MHGVHVRAARAVLAHMAFIESHMKGACLRMFACLHERVLFAHMAFIESHMKVPCRAEAMTRAGWTHAGIAPVEPKCLSARSIAAHATTGSFGALRPSWTDVDV